MTLKPDEVLCPMCGYSKDVTVRDDTLPETLYYCLACDHEFLESESGKLLVWGDSVPRQNAERR